MELIAKTTKRNRYTFRISRIVVIIMLNVRSFEVPCCIRRESTTSVLLRRVAFELLAPRIDVPCTSITLDISVREIARGSFDLVLPLCSLIEDRDRNRPMDRSMNRPRLRPRGRKKKMVEMKRKKEKRGEGGRKKKGKRNEIEFPSEKYRHRP